MDDWSEGLQECCTLKMEVNEYSEFESKSEHLTSSKIVDDSYKVPSHDQFSQNETMVSTSNVDANEVQIRTESALVDAQQEVKSIDDDVKLAIMSTYDISDDVKPDVKFICNRNTHSIEPRISSDQMGHMLWPDKLKTACDRFMEVKPEIFSMSSESVQEVKTEGLSTHSECLQDVKPEIFPTISGGLLDVKPEISSTYLDVLPVEPDLTDIKPAICSAFDDSSDEVKPKMTVSLISDNSSQMLKQEILSDDNAVDDIKPDDPLVESQTLCPEQIVLSKKTTDQCPKTYPRSKGVGSYACPICDLVFTKFDNMRQHCLTHTGPECSICQKVFGGASELKEHVLAQHRGKKAHICITCGRSFKRLDRLRMKRCLQCYCGEEPYSCKICNKKFELPKYLREHLLVHTGQKHHHCSVCEKSFTRPYSLKLHMMTHSGIKPYTCGVCGRAFRRTNALRVHMCAHTGEKPHVCKKCEKTFVDTSTLNVHMRTHTGEKPYACKTCNKNFSRSSTLKQHIRTHTGEKPYACKACDKTFTQRTTLKVHMHTHTGEKPYACKTCDKTFTRPTKLKEHMRTHTGEKPYRCKTCGKSFTASFSLRKHMDTHKENSHL